MRQLIAQAIQATKDQLREWDQAVTGNPTYTDEELVRRYERFHRGQPTALVEFARRLAPPGADLLDEALRYEAEMERLLQKRGG